MIKYIKPTDVLMVPGRIARCPECGDDLEIEIMEYTTDDQRVTVDGFIVHCTADTGGLVVPHNHELSAWERVYDSAHEWLYENVRIVDLVQSPAASREDDQP